MLRLNSVKELYPYILTKIPLSPLTKKTALVALSLFSAGAALVIYRKPIYLLLQNLKMVLFWRAEDYYTFAQSNWKNGTTTLPNGTTMNEQQLYLKVIELDPNLGVAYNNLALTLPPGGSITLPNGTTMNEQQLCLKAIELHPNLGEAYCILAFTLPPGGSITLPNGTTMDGQQLYLKAIELDPNLAAAYFNLARHLQNGESVLVNETETTKLALLEKAHKLAPERINFRNALAFEYNHLALTTNDVADKKKFSLRALELVPSSATAHYNVGRCLQNGETVVVNGTQTTKLALLEKAHELTPKDIDFQKALAAEYKRLGMEANNVSDKNGFYLRAVQLNPEDATYRELLASTFEGDQKYFIRTIERKAGQLHDEYLEIK